MVFVDNLLVLLSLLHVVVVVVVLVVLLLVALACTAVGFEPGAPSFWERDAVSVHMFC